MISGLLIKFWQIVNLQCRHVLKVNDERLIMTAMVSITRLFINRKTSMMHGGL